MVWSKPITVVMDLDSFMIHVNNCASACVANDVNHVISAVEILSEQYIRAMGGRLIKVHDKGTICWNTQDDEGKVHAVYIKDALYVPDATCILYWDQECYKRTLSYNPIANVARFCLAPGTISYQTLSALMNVEQDMEDLKKISFESAVVSSDKADHTLQTE
eukprot:8418844-Ditylum_brightwellii.AAC.1